MRGALVGFVIVAGCSSSPSADPVPAPSNIVDGIRPTRFRSCLHGEFWGFASDAAIAVVARAEVAGAATIALPDPSGRVTVEIRHGAYLGEEPVCMGTGITGTDRYRLDSVFSPTGFTGELVIGADECPTDGHVTLEHLVDADGTPFVSPLVLASSTALGCAPD